MPPIRKTLPLNSNKNKPIKQASRNLIYVNNKHNYL